MRQVLALSAALCIAVAPARAAFTVTLKAQNQNTSNHSVTVSAITATTGNILVVTGYMRMAVSTDQVLVTNSVGDTFTVYQCPLVATPTAVSFIAYAVTAGITGGTVTIADDAAATATAIMATVAEVTGGKTSSVEDSAARACGQGSATTSPTVTSNPGTQVGNLLISSYGTPTTATGINFVEDSGNGWTQTGGTGNTSIVGFQSYVTNAGAGGITHTPTTASRQYSMNVLALFDANPPAAGAAGGLSLRGVGN